MTIEIRDGGVYAVAWFLPGDDKDWFCVVYKLDGEPWQANQRIRYYAGTGDDDDDRKSWMTFKCSGEPTDRQRDLLVKKTDELAQVLIGQGLMMPGGELTRIAVYGGPEEFLDKIKDLPFMKITAIPGAAKA